MSRGVVEERVLGALHGALEEAKRKGQLRIESFPILSLDPPKRPEWGDLASTVAMSLAQTEQRSPQDVAQIIVENLPERDAIFDRVEIARPGFLNMTVKRDLWWSVLREVDAQGATYGRSDLGQGRRVLLEYVSANPTGPLHVGHGRGAAVGQVLAALLSATGYAVEQEYYINDAGRQMKLLGTSVFARYQELNGRSVDFPEDGYHGAYIRHIAEQLHVQYGDSLFSKSNEESERICRDAAYQGLLKQIRDDLLGFKITFQSWFSEAALLSAGAVEQALDELRQRNLLYEDEGALWFRSSAFGDEKDRVVRKREGDYTYLASDIAYHRDKLRRGYDLLIDVWGADHHGYIPRMEAVLQAYGHPKERLRVVLVQMVHLLRGGRKVEMSKRSGEFVTMREVMDEVGPDAAKFFFLMRRSDSHLDFDLDLAKQRSAENPVYYVQYAHARICSLFRVAAERGVAIPRAVETDLAVLSDPDELALIRKLASYPNIVGASAAALEPHRVTFYLQELAALLHTFYYKHRIMPALEADLAEAGAFIKDRAVCSSSQKEVLTPNVTAARLALMRSVQQVLQNGLAILGISAPERM